MRRSGDWLRQAEAALKQVKDSLENGNYWASCFFSQQAAEFAVKALLTSRGIERWRHSVFALLKAVQSLGVTVEEGLLREARELDKHHFQTRYVNTYHEGAPVDYYEENHAKESLRRAEIIFEFCRKSIRGS